MSSGRRDTGQQNRAFPTAPEAIICQKHSTLVGNESTWTRATSQEGLGTKGPFLMWSRLSEALAASAIQRHAQRLRRRVRRLTLNLDPTDDPTHGAQQWSLG